MADARLDASRDVDFARAMSRPHTSLAPCNEGVVNQRIAVLHGHLREHGLLTVDTEAQKYLMLAALNLVDCIADTAPPRVTPNSHSPPR